MDGLSFFRKKNMKTKRSFKGNHVSSILGMGNVFLEAGLMRHSSSSDGS